MTLARRGVVCAGNWIVDIVHTIDRWPDKSDLVFVRDEVAGVGGGPANVALDLAAMGAPFPVWPVGLLGTDRHGALARAACTAAGLETRWLAETATVPTAHTLVMNVPGDSRTFFYNPGTNDVVDAEHVPVADLAATGARIFYLGYLNLMAALDRLDARGGTGAARLFAQARAAGMMTCCDLVSADTPDFRAVVEASLPHIDILFLNEVEAARASGLPVAGADDAAGLAAAAAALTARGAGTVICHTPSLALWCAKGQNPVLARPASVDPAHIASPVGAGDAFCAGVILGLHEGWPPSRCLALAHAAAAASLTGATATDGIPPLAVLLAALPG